MEGGRTSADPSSGDLPATCAGLFCMVQHERVADKPDLVCGVMAGELKAETDAGKPNNKTLMQVERALVRAPAEYLFRCPNHCGLSFTEGWSVFPVHRMQPDPTPPAAAPSPLDEEEDEVVSVAGSSARISGQQARTFGERVLLFADGGYRRGRRGCGATHGIFSTEPARDKKQLEIKVSLTSQVRDTLQIFVDTDYGSLTWRPPPPFTSPPTDKIVSHELWNRRMVSACYVLPLIGMRRGCGEAVDSGALSVSVAGASKLCF